ncbi:hypothetical protein [Wenyingzhuangia sp. IMCC45574]
MENPTLLFCCETKQDAYYLKNFIQNTSLIRVEVTTTKDKKNCLVVDKSNVNKVKTIAKNVSDFLPSSLAKKRAQQLEKAMQLEQEEMETTEPVFGGFIDSITNKISSIYHNITQPSAHIAQ